MSESSSSSASYLQTRNSKWPFTFLLILLLPVIVGVVIYQLDSFDPAPYPIHELTQKQQPIITVPKRNGKMLQGAEKIGGYGRGRGELILMEPEDLAYDSKSGFIYTGCSDGWVNRVTVNESVADVVVERWINTYGRPLGLVYGHHGEVIIADGYKGLLNVTADGNIQVLTDEANGLKFKLTNAVDIAKDGTLYFTDSSYKYNLEEVNFDFLEGRPYGRLISYNPSTKQTKVLADNLYFPNGIAVSADNHFIIFCETTLRKCKRYYLQGEKKGSVDIFIDNLPGMPDNIMYDGEDLYWIALFTEYGNSMRLAQRYPIIRKLVALMMKYIGTTIPNSQKNGGVLAVDLEGKPVAHYYDEKLSEVSSGVKIGQHLYCGFVAHSGIIRLDLTRFPADD